MREVFAEAITLVNLPFTILLGVVMFYWLLVAVGALDANHGADAHGDFHHGDFHHDADGGGSCSWTTYGDDQSQQWSSRMPKAVSVQPCTRKS